MSAATNETNATNSGLDDKKKLSESELMPLMIFNHIYKDTH